MRRPLLAPWLLTLPVFALGCYDSIPATQHDAESDRVTPDTGNDAGPLDTGNDTGPLDAGPLDAGNDTGPPDTGDDTGPPDTGNDTGPSCAAPSALCGADCVNLQTSVAHCGVCNRACSTSIPNAVPSCVSGSCGFACAPGFTRVGSDCTTVMSPRPLSPLSTMTVSSLRPRLRWSRDGLSPALTGVRIDLCDRPDCSGTVESTIVDRDTLEATPAASLRPGRTYWWRLRGRVGSDEATPANASPIWQLRTHGRATDDSSRPNRAWSAGHKDLNGDGFDDLAVGVPSERRALVFWGGADGLVSSRMSSVEVPIEPVAPPTGAVFGMHVFLADTAGTGRARLYVNAASDSGGDGAVYEYEASVGGFSLSRTATVLRSGLNGAASSNFGASGAVGDFNSDGLDDLVFGTGYAPNYVTTNDRIFIAMGRSGGLGAFRVEQPPADASGMFGWKLDALGDLNGDGLPELGAVSALGPGGAAGTGRVTVLPGDRIVGLGTGIVHTGAEQRPRLFTGGCDLNGDGFGDTLESFALTGIGYRFEVRNGRPTFPQSRLNLVSGPGTSLTAAERGFQPQAACLDIDGDGLGDVITSWICYGGCSINNAALSVSPGRSSSSVDFTAASTFTRRGLVHGERILVAGDVNGDGYADLVMTEYLLSGEQTSVLVYLGRAGTGASAFAGPVVLISGLRSHATSNPSTPISLD